MLLPVQLSGGSNIRKSFCLRTPVLFNSSFILSLYNVRSESCVFFNTALWLTVFQRVSEMLITVQQIAPNYEF